MSITERKPGARHRIGGLFAQAMAALSASAARLPHSAWSIRGLSLVVVLSLWQVAASRTSPIFLPGPYQTVAALVKLVATGQLGHQLWVSLQSLLIGFAAAIVLGVVIGLVMGRWRPVEHALDVYMTALYAAPIVGLVPLFIIWFGIGFTARVAIVFLSSLFPVLVNAQMAVKQMDNGLLELGDVMGANERQTFTKLILPFSVPFILAGIRISIGRAIIGEIVAEQLMNLVGMGYLMIAAQNEFDTASVLAVTLVLMALGVGTSALLGWLESALVPWRRSLEVA